MGHLSIGFRRAHFLIERIHMLRHLLLVSLKRGNRLLQQLNSVPQREVLRQPGHTRTQQRLTSTQPRHTSTQPKQPKPAHVSFRK